MFKIYASLISQGFSYPEAMFITDGIGKILEQLGIDPWKEKNNGPFNNVDVFELTEDGTEIISGPDLR